MSKTDTYLTRINDIQYSYKVVLTNGKGNTVALTQDAVKLLVIQDDIFNPTSNGYMVISNQMAALQRGFKVEDVEVPAKFDFNLGDNDYVYIEIIPYLNENDGPNKVPELFKLKYLFTIYDSEDLQTDNPVDRFKKLYFRDIDAWSMMEKTSNFSTAAAEKDSQPVGEEDIPPYLRDDEDRMLPTGECIRKLLETAIEDFEYDEDKWEEGENQIFFTSPINNSYYDDLMYLVARHQSDGNKDFCKLSKNRDDVWTLEKFSDIAGKALVGKSKAGEYQLEAFVLAESGELTKIPKKTRVPTDYGFTKNIFLGDLSKIENYRLVEISKLDASKKLTTSIAHSHNFDAGQFRIETYNIDETIEFYEQEYAEKLNFITSRAKSTFLSDSLRNENRNLNHIYTPLFNTINSLEYASRNQVLQSARTLNLGLEFSVVGFPHRQSGTFFTIQKDYDFVDSDFEAKMQGQWYCVSVEHVFSESAYQNNLVGIKLNKSS